MRGQYLPSVRSTIHEEVVLTLPWAGWVDREFICVLGQGILDIGIEALLATSHKKVTFRFKSLTW